MQEFWRIWDFFSHHPESCHMFAFLLDDVGIPLSYRHMPGFGVHAFKLLNKAGVEHYVKFHWLPKLGATPMPAASACFILQHSCGKVCSFGAQAIRLRGVCAAARTVGVV